MVIPEKIRRRLGIVPGCQLDFSLEGNTIHAEVRRQMTPSKAEDGYGMLVCKRPGERRLSEFDVAQAMPDGMKGKAGDDRP